MELCSNVSTNPITITRIFPHWLMEQTLWQYGLWSFQTGVTKLERFLPKNQHTQRKLLNFENWVSGEVSKSAKSPNLLTFKVKFCHFLTAGR